MVPSTMSLVKTDPTRPANTIQTTVLLPPEICVLHWSEPSINCYIKFLIYIWLQISQYTNMSKFERKIISFEEGWDIVQKAVKNILEGLPDPHFTSDDFVMLYTYYFSIPHHIRFLFNWFYSIYIFFMDTVFYFFNRNAGPSTICVLKSLLLMTIPNNCMKNTRKHSKSTSIQLSVTLLNIFAIIFLYTVIKIEFWNMI
jgi:hypothetical protein